MMIYLVTSGHSKYEEYEIHEAFTDIALAKQYIALFPTQDLKLESRPDGAVFMRNVPKGMKPYEVELSYSGDAVIAVKPMGPNDLAEFPLGTLFPVVDSRLALLHVYVWADTSDHASDTAQTARKAWALDIIQNARKLGK
jgi:hypothetical protein